MDNDEQDEADQEDQAQQDEDVQNRDTPGDLQEAFAAGWRAKQKTASLRVKRGFVAPKSRADGRGKGSSASRADHGDRRPAPPDQRKASSRCADCGRLGHWRGDPECPKVISGEKDPFKKPGSPTKSASAPSSPAKAAYVTSILPVAHWVGMVGKDDKERDELADETFSAEGEDVADDGVDRWFHDDDSPKQHSLKVLQPQDDGQMTQNKVEYFRLDDDEGSQLDVIEWFPEAYSEEDVNEKVNADELYEGSTNDDVSNSELNYANTEDESEDEDHDSHDEQVRTRKNYQLKQSPSSLRGNMLAHLLMMAIIVIYMVYDIRLEQKTFHRNWRMDEAREYLLQVDPDLVTMAPPCTAWSQMQRVNQRNPAQIRRLHRQQREQRKILTFVDEVMQWQADRGRAAFLENPAQSLAWRQLPVVATASRPEFAEEVFDMCMHGLKSPDHRDVRYMKKTTKVIANPDICKAVRGH